MESLYWMYAYINYSIEKLNLVCFAKIGSDIYLHKDKIRVQSFCTLVINHFSPSRSFFLSDYFSFILTYIFIFCPCTKVTILYG